MKHFDTDYMEGCHPEVMQRLVDTNLLQTPGYGTDRFCKEAMENIRKALGTDDVDLQFLVGGTQTNSTVIDALLGNHEGVLCADTAHINVHESGAIEAFGHKVLTLPSHDGKVDAMELESYIHDFYQDETYEHMVAPGMLYISFPTEYGTIYSKTELETLHRVCQEADMPMFIDGARLGYGLASDACDIKLSDLPYLCDVFYIGGTKVGLLFGECVVARKGLLNSRHAVKGEARRKVSFFPLVKQHGALLAKGRLLGVQFSTLFSEVASHQDHQTSTLYESISKHAIAMAMRLKKGFIDNGYRLFLDSPTNQQFVILPNEVMDRLSETTTFEIWGTRGKAETTVRFVTSWATKETDVEALINEIGHSM